MKNIRTTTSEQTRMPRVRRSTKWGGVLAAAAVVVAGAGAFPAHAAPGDPTTPNAASAQGVLIDLDLLRDINVAALISADAANPAGPATDTASIDVALLNQLLGLNVPGINLPLIGDGTNGGLLYLGDAAAAGVLNGYANTPATGTASARAASGAVTNAGAIDVDAASNWGDGYLAVDLTALLSQLTLDNATSGVIDDLRLDLGALASTASATAGSAPTSTYTVAGAHLNVRSPLVSALFTSLNTQLAADLNSPLGSSGPIQTALNTVDIPPLSLLGLINVNLGTPRLVLPTNLETTLNALLGEPLEDANGLVQIDLEAGTIHVDLAQLLGGSGLNGLSPNTLLLTAAHVNTIVATITTLLDSLVDKVVAAVLGLDLTIDFDPTVSAILGTVSGNLDVKVNGTLAQLGGLADAGSPTVAVTGGLVVDLPVAPDVTVDISSLLTPITNAVVPAIQGVLGVLLTPTGPVLGVVTTTVTTLVTRVVNALDPVRTEVIPKVVSITVNSQPTMPTNTFSVRALSVDLLPGANVVALPLAASTISVLGAPTATGLAPNTGPTSGGTVVTITGTDFVDGATSVAFDSIPGTAVTVIVTTVLTVTSPAHAVGAVDATVTTPSGTTDPLTFTYTAVPVAPTISSLTPDRGPTAGGTSVTITGTGFTSASTGTFDGDPATVVFVSATELTATSPAHATPETVDVVVTSMGISSAPADFTYEEDPAPVVPTISSLSPDRGPTAGGTSVTIIGTGFTSGSTVTFDGDAATVVFVSATELTATSPAHATPETVDVVVTTAGTASAPADFTYEEDPAPVVPTISSLAPNSGPEIGGTVVTITGTDFTPDSTVTFGGVDVPVTFVDDTTITVVAPPHAPGAVDVTVTTNGETSNAMPYTYTNVLTVSGISPNTGPETGGTVVTIEGDGFTEETTVTVDGVEVPVTFIDGGHITIVMPPHAPGVVEIVVTDGDLSAPAGNFTYTAGGGGDGDGDGGPGDGGPSDGTMLPTTGAESPIALWLAALLTIGVGIGRTRYARKQRAQ